MFKFKNVLMNEAEPAEPSGSLLSTAQPQETVAPTEAAPVNNGPAVERPEWLLDKYATEDRDMNEAVSEQAKAYVELQKQFGGFTGAPEEYDFSMPEGIEGEIDTELPLFGEFTEWAKNTNLSNDKANELFGMFVSYQNSMQEQFATDFNAEKEKLGEQADQRIGNVAQWASANLDAQDMETLESMTMSADQISLIEKLIGKTRNTSTVKTHEANAVVTGFTEEDFKAAVTSDRYRTDAVYRRDIRKKAAALFPGQ